MENIKIIKPNTLTIIDKCDDISDCQTCLMLNKCSKIDLSINSMDFNPSAAG